jgi:two-component system chemotaxis response regulator CheY
MPTEENQPPVQEADTLPARILLVEDNVEVRQICRHVLVERGFLVNAVADGESGWAALQANKYDLLITDNNLPGLSGIDLVTNIREANICLLIILSAATIPQNSDRFGFAAILVKPYTVEDLERKVKEVLSHTSPQCN